MQTYMSSKGQIVIPAAVRRRLHLDQRTKFAIETPGPYTVLLKLARPRTARGRAPLVPLAPAGALPVTDAELEIEQFAGAPLPAQQGHDYR